MTTLLIETLIAAGNAQPEGSPAHQAARRAGFALHLQRASETVKTWPAWKQNLLGGCALSGKADCRDCTCFDDGPCSSGPANYFQDCLKTHLCFFKGDRRLRA